MRAWLASLPDWQRAVLAALCVPFLPFLIPVYLIGGLLFLMWASVADAIDELCEWAGRE